MRLKDFSFDSPQENILFDEVLLQLAEKQSNGEVLRFWESPKNFIVLGSIGKKEEDIWIEQAQKDGVPILRRTSGGGTVLQGPGCLNFTLVLSKERSSDLADLRKSYIWISAKVIEALKLCNVEAIFRPISDIALAGSEKKISGNAQHRSKNYILHHGSLLYNFDLNLISRYLRMPKDIPEYRKNRPHLDFVTNCSINPMCFKQALKDVFGLKTDLNPQQLSSQEVLSLQEFLQKRSVIVG
ncbi:MAG: lipoate--protein ligase family protein [Candidatus Omnitrophota bacterium]